MKFNETLLMMLRMILPVLLAVLARGPLEGQVRKAEFPREYEEAADLRTFAQLSVGLEDNHAASLGQRFGLAVLGSLALGMPFGYRDFTENYKLQAAAFGVGAIVGSSGAGIPSRNPNIRGSLAGALIGAAPLLLDLLEGSTGDTSGIELVVVPISVITIPLGAAAGGRWFRFGAR